MIRNLINLNYVEMINTEYQNRNMLDLKNPEIKEFHAICSYVKYECSFFVMDYLVKLRDLMGGHGFSSYSLFPGLINDSGVQSTWEGANLILIQQTAKYLLTVFSDYIQKGTMESKNLQFIVEFEDDEKTDKLTEEALDVLENFEYTSEKSNYIKIL